MPCFTRPDEPLNCRNVIVFDQRSAGYSFGEIECKAIYDEKFDAAYAEAEEALGPDAPSLAVVLWPHRFWK